MSELKMNELNLASNIVIQFGFLLTDSQAGMDRGNSQKPAGGPKRGKERGPAQLLRRGSLEWRQLIERLNLIKTKSNREVLCQECWQMLNCKQKIKHLRQFPEHKQQLLTSTQYASEQKICELALKHGKLLRQPDGSECLVSPFLTGNNAIFGPNAPNQLQHQSSSAQINQGCQQPQDSQMPLNLNSSSQNISQRKGKGNSDLEAIKQEDSSEEEHSQQDDDRDDNLSRRDNEDLSEGIGKAPSKQIGQGQIKNQSQIYGIRGKRTRQDLQGGDLVGDKPDGGYANEGEEPESARDGKLSRMKGEDMASGFGAGNNQKRQKVGLSQFEQQAETEQHHLMVKANDTHTNGININYGLQTEQQPSVGQQHLGAVSGGNQMQSNQQNQQQSQLQQNLMAQLYPNKIVNSGICQLVQEAMQSSNFTTNQNNAQNQLNQTQNQSANILDHAMNLNQQINNALSGMGSLNLQIDTSDINLGAISQLQGQNNQSQQPLQLTEGNSNTLQELLQGVTNAAPTKNTVQQTLKESSNVIGKFSNNVQQASGLPNQSSGEQANSQKQSENILLNNQKQQQLKAQTAGLKQQLISNLTSVNNMGATPHPRDGSPCSGFQGRNTSSMMENKPGNNDGKTNTPLSIMSQTPRQVTMDHIVLLEKKNKHLAQKLDDMSKKMDMIIKILEFIMGEFPHQRLQNMPDSLRGMLNPGNFKLQGGSGGILAKLYESQQQQQSQWPNSVGQSLSNQNSAQNQIAQALKQYQLNNSLGNNSAFTANQMQLFDGMSSMSNNNNMNQLMAMACAILQPAKQQQNSKNYPDLSIQGFSAHGGNGNQGNNSHNFNQNQQNAQNNDNRNVNSEARVDERQGTQNQKQTQVTQNDRGENATQGSQNIGIATANKSNNQSQNFNGNLKSGTGGNQMTEQQNSNILGNQKSNYQASNPIHAKFSNSPYLISTNQNNAHGHYQQQNQPQDHQMANEHGQQSDQQQNLQQNNGNSAAGGNTNYSIGGVMNQLMNAVNSGNNQNDQHYHSNHTQHHTNHFNHQNLGGIRNFDRHRRQSCGSNAGPLNNHQGGVFPGNFWHNKSNNMGGPNGGLGGRSGKSSLFATPQSIKPKDSSYPPIHSPHQRSQFNRQSDGLFQKGRDYSGRVSNSNIKKISGTNFGGLGHQIDAFQLGGAGGVTSTSMGGSGNINMITQNFLQNIQNPSLPYSMNLAGAGTSQLSQFMEMDPSRNINHLLNMGKFGNLDLNSFTQNNLKNRTQQMQNQQQQQTHGGQQHQDQMNQDNQGNQGQNNNSGRGTFVNQNTEPTQTQTGGPPQSQQNTNNQANINKVPSQTNMQGLMIPPNQKTGYDCHSPLITNKKIANSPFLQSVLNQNEQQHHLMPETGSMLFPCMVREDNRQNPKTGFKQKNDIRCLNTATHFQMEDNQQLQNSQLQTLNQDNRHATGGNFLKGTNNKIFEQSAGQSQQEEEVNKRKNPVRNFLQQSFNLQQNQQIATTPEAGKQKIKFNEIQRTQTHSNGIGNGNEGRNTPTLNCDQSASGMKQKEGSEVPNPEAQVDSATEKCQMQNSFQPPMKTMIDLSQMAATDANQRGVISERYNNHERIYSFCLGSGGPVVDGQNNNGQGVGVQQAAVVNQEAGRREDEQKVDGGNQVENCEEKQVEEGEQE